MSRKRKKSRSGSGKPAPSASSDSSSSSGGGSLSRMRGGLQGMFGGKKSNQPKTVLDRVWDVLFYVLLAAAIVFVLYSRFFRHPR